MIFLENSLSGKKEEFKPIKKGHVNIYDCGPTVYDTAHIGNLSAYIFTDIFRRTFEFFGYKVHQTMNITDIGHLVSDGDEGEDKMTKALKREGKPITLEAMREIANTYTDAFIDDLKKLNIELPNEFPKASEHIKEDVEIIDILLKKGVAYKISDGIYFDTSKFPSYGMLGGVNLALKNQKVVNANVNKEKKNNADFALWKFDSNLGYESPWGKGFPGWHIECSAMSRKYLGQPFDIHTGGVDHIPVHHNNEIAQSEAAYGVPLANYWLHSAFITVRDNKMSKSSGKFYTLAALEEAGIPPLAFRYWLLTSHYRSPVNFSIETLKAAETAFIRYVEAFVRLGETTEHVHTHTHAHIDYKKEFETRIADDFNTPSALALAWDMIKDPHLEPKDKVKLLLDFDKVFGLGLQSVSKIKSATKSGKKIPEEVLALSEARELARKNKEWDKADALRIEIENRGYEVKDGKKGVELSAIHKL